VEEWDVPPPVRRQPEWERFVRRWFGGWVGLFILKRGMSGIFKEYALYSMLMFFFMNSDSFPI